MRYNVASSKILGKDFLRQVLDVYAQYTGPYERQDELGGFERYIVWLVPRLLHLVASFGPIVGITSKGIHVSFRFHATTLFLGHELENGWR